MTKLIEYTEDYLAALPKSRAEAKALGVKRYFTGKPCKHGHVAPRQTSGVCVQCNKGFTNAYLVSGMNN